VAAAKAAIYLYLAEVFGQDDFQCIQDDGIEHPDRLSNSKRYFSALDGLYHSRQEFCDSRLM